MYNLIFGMKTINISQLPKSKFSHNYGLLAVDLSGQDTGIDLWYAQGNWKCLSRWYEPAGTHLFGSCDEKGNMAKVHCADGVDRVVTLSMTHSNINYKVGRVYKSGEVMYREGTKGYATGNHIHLEIGEGWQYKKIRLNNQYRLLNALNPLEVMFVLSGFSIVKNTLGANLKYIDSLENNSSLESEVFQVSNNVKEGFEKVYYKGQLIYLYKQKQGEDIGLLSVDEYKELKRIDKYNFKSQGHEITCMINASYFIMNGNEKGQVLGREQSFTKDERPDQREWLDLVVTNDNRLISGNFSSWEWLKDSVKLGLSYACCVLKNGYAEDEYSPAVGIGKYSNKNTQTLLMQDNERFYFAVVRGKMNGYDCREFAKSIGMTDCYMLDSGGSSQMLTVEDEGYITGRAIPNVLVFYKKKSSTTNSTTTQEDTQGIKSIGIIKVHSVGLRVRETLKFSRDTLEPIGKILKTIRIGGFIELVDFVPGIQPDGYQWTKVLNNGKIAYCQYDSKVYTVELYK